MRRDTLIGITEVAVAGSNDTLIADGGTDVLSAAGSGDTLIGGSATTTLVSNAGGNTLEAGTDVPWPSMVPIQWRSTPRMEPRP